MKREQILQRLGYCVPESRKKRVIVHSDIKNEADDQYAIIQHLLTPTEDVIGIIAGHFCGSPGIRELLAKIREVSLEEFQQMIDSNENYRSHMPKLETSMQCSFEEGVKLLEAANIDDIPLLRGSSSKIVSRDNLPESEGADFIIKEALKNNDEPIYIALQGCLTDLAIAYLKQPQIASKIIAIWIGGGEYPNGGLEYNLSQDVEAVRIIFESPIAIWQIPQNVYKTIEISFAELSKNVKSCGKLGKYLCDEMFQLNDFFGEIFQGYWPHGETWCIGDNPTVSVLLQSPQRESWHVEKAPYILDDGSYQKNENGKEIRVYDSIDTRLTCGDLFAKLQLCYGS